MTIRDVARRAGVSTTLVSFVLTGKRRVGEARRRRVLQAIDELGYTPNAAARGLRLRRTGLVACLIPYLNNPLYSLHAMGAEQELGQAGLLTVVASTRGAAAGTRAGLPAHGEPAARATWGGMSTATIFHTLRGSRVDGVLLFPYQEDVPQVARLVGAGTPVVFLDREPVLTEPLPLTDAAVVDNEHGVYRATEHLLELGHRRIGLVSLRADSLSGAPRLAGYRRAFAERGLPVAQDCLALGRGSVADGRELTRGLLDLRPRITGLVVAVTNCTPGALQAIHHAGWRVPDDLSVVGYSHDGAFAWPAADLTAIRYPGVELGREAARLLLTRLQHPLAQRALLGRQRVVLQPELRPGSSTRPLAAETALP
ncbi:MAG TPA: LacI family DNA-binding transcriptional regulator [Chloroflexota bacterium]|nr:LacI family DNA-binding transcriptional regulator [Chloroflexota bacterium]